MKCFHVWEVGPVMIKRVFASVLETGTSFRHGQTDRPVIVDRQGHLSLDQVAKSPVQRDLLNHGECPGWACSEGL